MNFYTCNIGQCLLDVSLALFGDRDYAAKLAGWNGIAELTDSIPAGTSLVWFAQTDANMDVVQELARRSIIPNSAWYEQPGQTVNQGIGYDAIETQFTIA